MEQLRSFQDLTVEKPFKVLVFPAGTEIGLEIHAALKFERDFQLFGASSVEDHATMVFERCYSHLSLISEDGFLAELNELLEANDIDAIYPAHDDVVTYLASRRDKVNAKVIAPSADTCSVCRSKRETYFAFAGSPWIPRVDHEVSPDLDFPVFVKPDKGEGSRGACRIDSFSQLNVALDLDPTLVICEYLPGPEYTVDCYSNTAGELLFVGMRERTRVRNGISVRSAPMSAPKEVVQIANRINDRLELCGGWFFQLKMAADGNTLKLLEVAPRIAGTMSVHRVLGVNFAAMAIHEARGRKVSVLLQDDGGVVDRALVNRYPKRPISHFYIDFDDTLIIGGPGMEKVNSVVVMLLYQCRNAGIPITLITRHRVDPRETLKRLGISENIFTEIIWLRGGQPKSSCIKADADVVFVDDSFKERREVRQRLGVATFALDSLERLVDWRR